MNDNDTLVDDLRNRICELEEILHGLRAHPDYEYETTECGRKQFDDKGMPASGWEENIIGGDPHSSWERFDYYEEHYWRRRKASAAETPTRRKCPECVYDVNNPFGCERCGTPRGPTAETPVRHCTCPRETTRGPRHFPGCPLEEAK
jgi:hypothetical protein